MTVLVCDFFLGSYPFPVSSYDLHDRLCRRRGPAHRPQGAKYARAKGLYEADRKTLIKSSQHNPILKTLYEKLLPEKAHELLHVHYPQPE